MLAHFLPQALLGNTRGVGRLGNVALVLQQCRANERVFACRHVAVQRGKRDRVSANERRWISRRACT
jgi:hypothetical protein